MRHQGSRGGYRRQKRISRKLRRLFYDAGARHVTLTRAVVRVSAPFRADYSPLNSVVYLDFWGASYGHDREGTLLTVGVGRDGTILLDPMVGEPVAYATGFPAKGHGAV